MKIAISYIGRNLFTNFRKIKISEKNKKYSRKFTFKLIFFLISITTFHCFSTTISSKVEIQKKSQINYYKSDSLSLPKAKTLSASELDTDKDGIIDILDLDDDNDGILDNHEGFRNLHSIKNEGLIITMNGAWVLVFTSVYFELPSDLSHGDEFWIPFMGSQYVKAVRIRFENTENGIKFIQTAAKHTIGNDPDLDTNLNYDFDNGGIVAPIAVSDTDEGYGIASIEYKDKVIIPDYLSESGKVWLSSELDTDNDGFIDSRDTDSDNDGCPDTIEAENNLTTIATLNNGSNGGSLGNLGTISNNNGIPLPLGTIEGNEFSGQLNSDAVLTSEQLTVAPLTNVIAKVGDNVSIPVTASAIKTVTYNIGVPNYNSTYGTDTSDLIVYNWYKETDLNTVISTSKTLIINSVNSSNVGTYIVKVKSAGNSCIVEESVTLTSEGDVLGGIENFDKLKNSFVAYPNPSQGNINLLLSSKKDSEVKITLFDISGKEIFSTSKKLTEGKNKIDFNVKVDSGLLFLKVLNEEVNYGTTKIIFK